MPLVGNFVLLIAIIVMYQFFVDLALPATLTLDDEITVPVVVYNYLDEEQTVEPGEGSVGHEGRDEHQGADGEHPQGGDLDPVRSDRGGEAQDGGIDTGYGFGLGHGWNQFAV